MGLAIVQDRSGSFRIVQDRSGSVVSGQLNAVKSLLVLTPCRILLFLACLFPGSSKDSLSHSLKDPRQDPPPTPTSKIPQRRWKHRSKATPMTSHHITWPYDVTTLITQRVTHPPHSRMKDPLTNIEGLSRAITWLSMTSPTSSLTQRLTRPLPPSFWRLRSGRDSRLINNSQSITNEMIITVIMITITSTLVRLWRLFVKRLRRPPMGHRGNGNNLSVAGAQPSALGQNEGSSSTGQSLLTSATIVNDVGRQVVALHSNSQGW